MAHLSPETLTCGEQTGILKASSRNARDHLIYSLALGTGLRLAEIVGLNAGVVYLPGYRLVWESTALRALCGLSRSWRSRCSLTSLYPEQVPRLLEGGL